MNKILTLAATVALISGQLIITSCSSSDDGGGGTATVPANAIEIDANNAEPLVAVAVSSATALGTIANAAETTQILSLQSAINIIQPILKNISTANVATAADFSEPCSGGGTISGSSTETVNGDTYTETGTASFNDCIEFGYTINGSVSFTSSENDVTGAYSNDISGSITVALSTSDSFSFSNFAYEITGNNQLLTYTISQLTYAIEFVSSTESGGFLVTLTAPIVESTSDFCPESGHITITGANSTTAEGIYNGDGSTMTIKANGVVVNATAPCYY